MNNWYNPYDPNIQWGEGVADFLKKNKAGILKFIKGLGHESRYEKSRGENDTRHPDSRVVAMQNRINGPDDSGEPIEDILKTGGIDFSAMPLEKTPTGGFIVGGGGGEVDMSGLTGSPADYYLGSMPGSEKRRPGAVVGGGGAGTTASPAAPGTKPAPAAAAAGKGKGLDQLLAGVDPNLLKIIGQILGGLRGSEAAAEPRPSLRGQYATGGEYPRNASNSPVMTPTSASAAPKTPGQGVRQGGATNYPKASPGAPQGEISLRGQYASGGQMVPNYPPGQGLGAPGVVSNANPALGNQNPMQTFNRYQYPSVGAPYDAGNTDVSVSASYPNQSWQTPVYGGNYDRTVTAPMPMDIFQKMLAWFMEQIQANQGGASAAPGLREK